jgi:hypothetical protein
MAEIQRVAIVTGAAGGIGRAMTRALLAVMAPPLVWLVSDAAGKGTGRRFLGVHWDPKLAARTSGREGWGTGGMDQHRYDADHPEQVLVNPRPRESGGGWVAPWLDHKAGISTTGLEQFRPEDASKRASGGDFEIAFQNGSLCVFDSEAQSRGGAERLLAGIITRCNLSAVWGLTASQHDRV